jgi:hypothetical protein
MRHYEELARYQREGFEVIVDKTWEDISLSHCFDDECYDIAEMEAKVNSYELDWFMLRVRVLLDGHELGSHYLGGMLYEDARECLTDGTAEDSIYAAIEEAKQEARRLQGSLQRVIDTETV